MAEIELPMMGMSADITGGPAPGIDAFLLESPADSFILQEDGSSVLLQE